MLDPTRATVDRHGGLRLDLPLAEVDIGEAVDLLDVDWHQGVLGSREGAKAFTPGAGASHYDRMFGPTTGGRETAILIGRRGKTLVAFSASDGKEIAGKSIAVSEDLLSFTRFGIPSGGFFIPVTYIADGASIKKFAGNVPAACEFSSPTATVDGVAGKAMPKGWYLANWKGQGNRLVVAGTAPEAEEGGPGGALSSPSHVWFSEPGQPESFSSTSYVALGPGEDEDITGCCVWNNQVFVFKETCLFVFWGVSADGEGNPIFNFKEVDLGTRMLSHRGIANSKKVQRVAAGREGVYFVTNDGVFVTTGGEPTCLSSALRPLGESRALNGPAEETLPAETARWRYAWQIEFLGDSLYVLMPGRLLKLDLETMRWMVWSAAANNITPWVEQVALFDNVPRMYLSAAEGEEKIYLYTPDKDEDPTVEMDPRWQSGAYDLADVDEKTLTNTKVWGSGEVEVKVAEDFGPLGDGTTFKLGEGAAIAQQQKQKGQTATLFSHRLSGAAPWSVQRLSRYLRETRVPATQKQ